MPGACRDHNPIVSDPIPVSHVRVKGRPCDVYPCDMRLQVAGQDKPDIEHYVRQPGGAWLFRGYCGPEETLPLSTFGCEVPIADVHHPVPLADHTEA